MLPVTPVLAGSRLADNHAPYEQVKVKSHGRSERDKLRGASA
jgi:hypothetical protein